MTNEAVYNVIGIGIGPFNLGLAALSNPISGTENPFPGPEMVSTGIRGLMIDHVTLQTPFYATVYPWRILRIL